MSKKQLLQGSYNVSSSLKRNFNVLACFCDCTGRYVSGLIGNSEDFLAFSCVAAQIIYTIGIYKVKHIFTRPRISKS